MDFAIGSIKSNQLEIDFNEFISLERKQKTSGIERQVTISRYATAFDFNFEAVHEAIQRCKIRINDDFGVIQVRTSKDNESTTKTDSSIVELNVGSEPATRALERNKNYCAVATQRPAQ